MLDRVVPCAEERRGLGNSDDVDGAKGNEGAQAVWIHSMQAEVFFGAWILLNALVIAIETDNRADDDNDWGWILIESIFNVVFLVEMLMRMVAEGSRWPCSMWNLFDAVLVVIGVVDVWILYPAGATADIRFLMFMRLFRLLRLMRVLRVIRVLRNARELLLLISGIVGAFKAMVWGMILLGFMIFICALLVTRIVGKRCCLGDDTFTEAVFDEGQYSDLFGTMPRSIFTLFQFTAEFQPDIVRATWEDGAEGYLFTLFLIFYALASNIVILNIIASVIVDVVMGISASKREEEKAEEKEEARKEITGKVDQLFQSLDINEDRMLQYSELFDKNTDHVQRVFKAAGLLPSDAKELFRILDKDSNGIISPLEFRDSLARLKQTPDAKDILRIECSLESVGSEVDKFIEAQAKVVDVLGRITLV